MISVKKVAPLFLSIFVVIIFALSGFTLLKVFPIVSAASVFIIFLASFLKDENIKDRRDVIVTDKSVKIDKKKSLLLVIFLFINLLLALGTAFLSDVIWMLYNGIFSYILLGFLFFFQKNKYSD